MNTPSASRAEGPARDEGALPATRRVLVWDAPVRVFHWMLVASFALAWITGDSERWRLAHVAAGYTMVGLVVFRLVWGFVGTRHARFADFVRGPAAAGRYLRSLLSRRPEHHVGHNPAGALAIVALLALVLLTAASGWITYQEIADAEELHEFLSHAMLLLVVLHVGAVLVSSLLHRENLVASMVTGRKQARPEEAIGHAWRSVAALMLVAVLGFWWLQWSSAPLGERAAVTARADHGDEDDD